MNGRLRPDLAERISCLGGADRSGLQEAVYDMRAYFSHNRTRRTVEPEAPRRHP